MAQAGMAGVAGTGCVEGNLGHQRGRIKADAVREFLKGVPRAQLEADAREFAEKFSRSMLRPDAVAAWKRWRNEPVQLGIVKGNLILAHSLLLASVCLVTYILPVRDEPLLLKTAQWKNAAYQWFRQVDQLDIHLVFPANVTEAQLARFSVITPERNCT